MPVNNDVLYEHLCCVIAEWTEGWIIEFLGKLTKDATAVFNEHRAFDSEFRLTFKRAIDSLLSEDYVINSARILLVNVLAFYPGSAYYSDVTVLRTLAALHIKLTFVKNYGTNARGPSEMAVVRSTVEELYGVQCYLAANCRRRRGAGAGGDHPVRETDAARSSNAVDSFLVVVNAQFPDANRPDCETKTMLLANIVTLPPEDVFARSVLQSSFVVEWGKTVKICDMLTVVSGTLDSEYIYMYQKAVMTATMKFIYNSTVTLSRSHNSEDKQRVLDLVDSINSKISDDPQVFPELLVDGFMLLDPILKDRPNWYKRPEHVSYRTLLVSVELYEETFFEKFLILLSTKIPLIKLLKKILNNMDDFKCIHESVKYRSVEHEKHHMGFLETKNDIASGNHPPREIFQYESDNVCKFVLNISLTCYTTVTMPTDDKILTNFPDVFQYILVVLKNESDNLNFIKILINVAIILINVPSENPIHHKQNVLNVIMIKLNIFGTKYCNPNTFKFWFNIVSEPNSFIDHEFLKQYMETIDNSFSPRKSNIYINDPKFLYINIDLINYRYVKSSSVIKKYGKYVKFYWKWEQLSINEFYKDDGVINSDDLYAFYDMYFKFYVAIIFYIIKEYYNKNKSGTDIKSKLATLNSCLDELNVNKFPFKLKYLIEGIQQMIQIGSDNVTTNEDSRPGIPESIKKINGKLIQNGIRFQKPTELNTTFQWVFNYKSKSLLRNINKDLKTKVQYVNSLYLKLQLTNDIINIKQQTDTNG